METKERFWTNYPPGPQSPTKDMFALVDDDRGEIAYFLNENDAIAVANILSVVVGFAPNFLDQEDESE